MKKLYIGLSILLFSFIVTGCKRNDYQYIEGKVNIVATTTMLGDLAKEVGGDYVNVKTLMGVGVDPHLYQPKASDTNAIQKADLVIINGLHLEGQMGEVIERIDKKRLLVIGDHFEQKQLIYDENQVIDPHIWFDVSNWMTAAEAVGDKLKSMDQDNIEVYENRKLAYLDELDTLNKYIINRINEIDESKRILVTAHDAFAYFARAYGFSVYAIQGISTQSEASVKDIQDLAQLIKSLNVKAIFIESSVPQSTINSVIEASATLGHQVTIGGELYSDSLGDASHGTDTYVKTVRHNIDTIIDALK